MVEGRRDGDDRLVDRARPSSFVSKKLSHLRDRLEPILQQDNGHVAANVACDERRDGRVGMALGHDQHDCCRAQPLRRICRERLEADARRQRASGELAGDLKLQAALRDCRVQQPTRARVAVHKRHARKAAQRDLAADPAADRACAEHDDVLHRFTVLRCR
jgi:hypothetical protein